MTPASFAKGAGITERSVTIVLYLQYTTHNNLAPLRALPPLNKGKHLHIGVVLELNVFFLFCSCHPLRSLIVLQCFGSIQVSIFILFMVQWDFCTEFSSRLYLYSTLRNTDCFKTALQ